MKLSNSLRFSVISLLLASMAGCAMFSQQDFDTRVAQSLEPLSVWSISNSAQAQRAMTLIDLISIPELEQIINQAMDHNPSVQQTAFALQIAYAQQRQVGADQLPSLGLNINASDEEQSERQFNTELSVSWELDIWQKIADSKAASSAQLASSAADYQAAKDALAASIMRQWLSISLYQQKVRIEQQRLVSLDANQTFVSERYRKGLGGLEDLDSAKSSSESTKATIAEYQEALAAAQRNLKVLLGQLGDYSLPEIPDQFPQVILPLADVPDQDLARRPDLIAAFADIQAQQYTTQVAYKAMLPSLSLSAALSDTATHLSDSLLTSPLWSILGQVTAPLFQGGRLKAEAQIEALKTEQTFWAYQETLLNAVNEVEDALSQEQALERQQQHLGLALESVRRSEASYQDKYRMGLVDILNLLTAQQQVYDIEIQLAQVTYNRLSNRVGLGLALGLGVINEAQ